MGLADKYSFTPEENRRFARSQFTELVHTAARFEGVNTTLPQTQTIMDGMSVAGVPANDVVVILNLKRAWDYVTNSTMPTTLELASQINRIVAANDSLDPGGLRTGTGGVTLGGGKHYTPPDVDRAVEERWLAHTVAKTNVSATERALEVMYHLMRGQLFWDGNKRTAQLVANKIMMDHGAGLINVPLEQWETWNTLISEFYLTGEPKTVLGWTYEHAIVGLSVRTISPDGAVEKLGSASQNQDT